MEQEPGSERMFGPLHTACCRRVGWRGPLRAGHSLAHENEGAGDTLPRVDLAIEGVLDGPARQAALEHVGLARETQQRDPVRDAAGDQDSIRADLDTGGGASILVRESGSFAEEEGEAPARFEPRLDLP